MKTADFLKFCQKLEKTPYQLRRATVASAAMLENGWLSPDIINISHKQLKNIWKNTPKRVQLLIDLAIATGNTKLGGVIVTESEKNLEIKLGLTWRNDAPSLDFKAYTPDGTMLDDIKFKYKPSPQKLASIQGGAKENLEIYTKWMNSKTVDQDVLNAFVTLGQFMSHLDRIMTRLGFVTDKMNERDYIMYRISETPHDVPNEFDTVLRFDKVDSALDKAKIEFHTIKNQSKNTDRKVLMEQLIYKVEEIQSYMSKILQSDFMTSGGIPLYTVEEAEAHYTSIALKIQSLFVFVNEIAEHNFITREDLIKQMKTAGQKIPKRPQMSGIKRIKDMNWDDPLSPVTVEWDKRKEVPFNVEGMSSTEKDKAWKKYRILEYLDEQGILARRKVKRVKGHHDMVEYLQDIVSRGKVIYKKGEKVHFKFKQEDFDSYKKELEYRRHQRLTKTRVEHSSFWYEQMYDGSKYEKDLTNLYYDAVKHGRVSMWHGRSQVYLPKSKLSQRQKDLVTMHNKTYHFFSFGKEKSYEAVKKYVEAADPKTSEYLSGHWKMSFDVYFKYGRAPSRKKKHLKRKKWHVL